MNVASLELCRELYELSGWRIVTTNDQVDYEWCERDGIYDVYLHVGQEGIPAYNLGYLIRKLPNELLRHDLMLYKNKQSYGIGFLDDEGGTLMDDDRLTEWCETAPTPEDAACKLAIELLKAGVLTKETT
jgi:hypothetical protein